MDIVSQPQQPHPPQSEPQQTSQTQQVSYRAQLVQKASAKIPYTAEGLPVGLYRVDLLPISQTTPLEEVQSLKTAYIDLSYEHGYPTLPDGRPYWQKLGFEPGFAFGAFQIYLELINDGPREISQLYDNQELLQLSSRMKGLPPGQSVSPQELGITINEFAILYYWRTRSKAYDLYKEASFRHQRLRRQMTSEEKHYSLATTLMKELEEKVFQDPEFWQHMSGKTAVDLLGKLVAIQRVSVGLPAQGPLSQKETPESTTFEMIMRTLGQKAAGNTYEHAGNQAQSRELLDTVLKDKGSTENLQELIIRVTKAQHDVLPSNEPQARTFKGRNRTNGSRHEIITTEDITGYDISGVPGAQDPDTTPNLDNNSIVSTKDKDKDKDKQ